MKLHELVENQYKAKSFFGKSTHAVKLVTDRGKEVAKFIKKNCAAWLKETENGKGIVLRGYAKSGDNQMAFTKKVRKKRIPMDTEDHEHKAYMYMIKKCGKVANRENSVFVTGDYGTASDYGNVFVTIPIGQFNYTWHHAYEDWTHNVDLEYYLKYKPTDKEEEDNIHLRPDWIPGEDHHSKLDTKLLQDFCQGLHGDDGSLMRGINTGNEIMLSCNTVLAVEEDFYSMVVWPLLAGKPVSINNARAELLLKGFSENW